MPASVICGVIERRRGTETNVVVMTARQANPVALVRSKHVLVTKAAMAKLEQMLK